MKRPVVAALVFAGVFSISLVVAATASGDTGCSSDPASCESGALCLGSTAHTPHELIVEAGEYTEVDRGRLSALPHDGFLVGSYRYWAEEGGAMLYVYDDVGNLIARVRSPASVTVLGPAGPQS